MDGTQEHFPGEHQLQEDGQRNAALMQSLMHAAAAGMGQHGLPMMQMGRAPGMPGQPGLPMQQVRISMCSRLGTFFDVHMTGMIIFCRCKQHSDEQEY